MGETVWRSYTVKKSQNHVADRIVFIPVVYYKKALKSKESMPVGTMEQCLHDITS